MAWFLALFFVSGFCSILYEIVWLRLAMAQFGVTSPMVSIVLSMFMAGLGFGSWLSGRMLRNNDDKLNFPALRFYALIELLIGVSAIAVPYELKVGGSLLSNLALSSSGSYYLVSGVWVALTLVPWCACMGATIPVAMRAIRNSFPAEAQHSFSYLYLANVSGAVAGATVPLLLIEVYGFHGTLRAGAALNLVLAVAAMSLSFGTTYQKKASAVAVSRNSKALRVGSRDKSLLALLFATGCTSMGIEVVWIRQFTPYRGTVVYAFASILALYLAATFIGSQIYRRLSRDRELSTQLLWACLGLSAVFSAVAASPQWHTYGSIRLILGIVPFSGLLGFITPMLVDRWSAGDPAKAGSAYAVNVLGCIAGPLLAGFLLLPFISERWVLFLFALPWFVVGVRSASTVSTEASAATKWQPVFSYSAALLAIVFVFFSHGFEDQFTPRAVRRDNTATSTAYGQARRKMLLVNGQGMTALTPNPKMMAHLPLAFLPHPPQNALVICFGMGTTYRSFLSWNISTTAVELVPSVPKLLWFFHPDAPQLTSSPLSHVVIDDGRRYLERTADLYDVIVIDPPPPVEAAGSSLLYSKEFYAAAKHHLRPGGILQQWLPGGDPVVQTAVARALKESFPYLRAFHSVLGGRLHYLASEEPFPNRAPAELVQQMPPSAVQDMMEWGPQATPEAQFAVILNSEVPLDKLIDLAPNTPALQDDRPSNEYYLLRLCFGHEFVERLAGLTNPAPLVASR